MSDSEIIQKLRQNVLIAQEIDGRLTSAWFGWRHWAEKQRQYIKLKQLRRLLAAGQIKRHFSEECSLDGFRRHTLHYYSLQREDVAV